MPCAEALGGTERDPGGRSSRQNPDPYRKPKKKAPKRQKAHGTSRKLEFGAVWIHPPQRGTSPRSHHGGIVSFRALFYKSCWRNHPGFSPQPRFARSEAVSAGDQHSFHSKLAQNAKYPHRARTRWLIVELFESNGVESSGQAGARCPPPGLAPCPTQPSCSRQTHPREPQELQPAVLARPSTKSSVSP